MTGATGPTRLNLDRLRQLYAAGDLDGAERLAQTHSAGAAPPPDILNVQGMIAYRRGDFVRAAAQLQAAITLEPSNGALYANLGAALRAQGDLPAAEAVYRQALEVSPNVQPLHGNLANVLLDQNKFAAAEACAREALRHGQATGNLMNTLGLSLNRQGRLVEAAAAFRHALEVEPGHYDACRNLGSTLAGMAQFDEAESLHRRALTLRPDYSAGHSSLLFGLNYRPDLTAEAIAAEYRAFDARYGRAPDLPEPAHAVSRDPNRRLRLGYVSPDFADHVVAAFMLPIFQAHDRGEIELHCYAEVRHPDAVTAQVRATADAWVNTVGLSDQALAERIRRDQVDILIDLAGHTTGNRLLVFAERPAPVQLTYFIGAGATTGLSAIDGFLTDVNLAPPGSDALFGERRVLRLDRAALAFTPSRAMPPVTPPPALTQGRVSLGYFGRSIRLNEGVIRTWSAILNAAPTSRLMLNNAPFGDPATADLFAQRFARYGVGRDQLELVNTTPQDRTWAAYGEIDIALDPFPHNAGTTTIEALWMGVPVLSLADRPTVGRMGAMILKAMGLDDWVAPTREAYVAHALRAMGDIEALAALRRDLRPRFQASPLGDPVGLARALERAYRRVWREWCGQPVDGGGPDGLSDSLGSPLIPK